MTVGLPRMHQEPGERRDFLPAFVAALGHFGPGDIVIERGYGAGMRLSESAYLTSAPSIRIGDREEALQQGLVIVLRCPDEDALRRLKPGTILLSMLHYPSHPERALLLHDLGVSAISLDSIVDDSGRRLIENMRATGWNGVQAAFQEIRRLHPKFGHPSRRPIRVTCIGSGTVGGHAVHAATRYGDPKLREEMVSRDVPGVEVTVVDFDLTWHEYYMLSRLEQTDLLIDATLRSDLSRPVIPNEWVGALPQDAVILDLAADPYDFSAEPPLVKGIEGLPAGNLDRYVFPVSDPAFDALDPIVDTGNRRLVLSCYSWPGLDPTGSMKVYGEQIEPLLELVLREPGGWDPEQGSRVERALARAEVSRWLRTRAA